MKRIMLLAMVLFTVALLFTAGQILAADKAKDAKAKPAASAPADKAKPADKDKKEAKDDDGALDDSGGGGEEEGGGEEGAKPVAQSAPEGPGLLPTEEMELPKVDKPLNKPVTITYKIHKKNKRDKKPAPAEKLRVVSGTLIAVYQEMVPWYAAQKREWLLVDNLNVVRGVDEQTVNITDIESISFDKKYEAQYREKDDWDLISCTTVSDAGMNRRECIMLQQYNVKTKGKKGGVATLVSNSQIMFLIKNSKGQLERVTFYLGKIKIDNRKNEINYKEKDMSELLDKAYYDSPESIIFR